MLLSVMLWMMPVGIEAGARRGRGWWRKGDRRKEEKKEEKGRLGWSRKKGLMKGMGGCVSRGEEKKDGAG